MDAPRPLRIGTRASALALAQTRWVAERLGAAGTTVEVTTISTRGDQGQNVPVHGLGADGVFVRELEQAILEGHVDAAVHSLKDLPTAETPGLMIACVPERALAFDVLVARAAARLADLPAGAIVGTSSIRRVVQLKALRPDLDIRPVRGNVDTRLRKLDDGGYDALILAGAGLERLGRTGRITEVLQPPAFWPAVSQGALGIQARADDPRTRELLAGLDHTASHDAVRAERACLAALAGGCLAPIGAWARHDESGTLVLGGCVLEDDGAAVRRIVVDDERGDAGDAGPEALGRRVAAGLVARGAAGMLARARTADSDGTRN